MFAGCNYLHNVAMSLAEGSCDKARHSNSGDAISTRRMKCEETPHGSRRLKLGRTDAISKVAPPIRSRPHPFEALTCDA